MADYRLNFNENQGEGEPPVQRLLSSDSVPKDKDASLSDHAGQNNDDGGGGGGAAAGGGGGGGAAKFKSTKPMIIALVADVLTAVASVLSCYCSYLWWDWPWVLTVPALALGIVACIMGAFNAFGFKGHDEAVYVCAAITIILALAAIIWCAVEIAWCHSYQGSLYSDEVDDAIGDFSIKVDTFEEMISKHHYNMEYGHLCKGRCYDWSNRKELLTKKMDCDRKVEKWYLHKYLDKMPNGCQTSAYLGVDSYSQSPIYQSHGDIVMANKVQYGKSESAEAEQKIRKEKLKDICDNFDGATKLAEKIKECEKKLKKSFKPKCFKEYGGFFFAKGRAVKEIEKKDECEMKVDGTKMYIYTMTNSWNLLKNTDPIPTEADPFFESKPRAKLGLGEDSNPLKRCKSK